MRVKKFGKYTKKYLNIKNQTKIRLKYNFYKHNFNKWAVRIHSNDRKLLKSDHIQKYQTRIFSNPQRAGLVNDTRILLGREPDGQCPGQMHLGHQFETWYIYTWFLTISHRMSKRHLGPCCMTVHTIAKFWS